MRGDEPVDRSTPLVRWETPNGHTGVLPGCSGVRGGMKRIVGEVMTNLVVQMPDETNLVEAARAMRNQDIGDVVVTQREIVAGLVTDRDIVVRGIAEGLDPATTCLRDVLVGP